MSMPHQKLLSAQDTESLLNILKARFLKNTKRHPDTEWGQIEEKLLANPAKLWSLSQMENTGGEPDVIGQDLQTHEYIFCDCSAESPKERRSICYDPEALQSRKENKPWHSAAGMASEMGIELMTEEEYHTLQLRGPFDLKTSSWLKTAPGLRKLGGAIFGDHRYSRTFIYHNGAESYYAARGFRGILRV